MIAAIAGGGFLGSVARYSVGLQWPVRQGEFPISTFFINLSGAFALGLILTLLLVRQPQSLRLRKFLCTGILGGWTTMSALAVELVRLVDAGRPAIAVSYLALTAVLSMFAGAIGITLARKMTAGRFIS